MKDLKILLAIFVMFICGNAFGQEMRVEVTPQPDGEAPIVKTILVTEENNNYIVYVYVEKTAHEKQMVMSNKGSKIISFISINKDGVKKETKILPGQRIFVHEHMNFELSGATPDSLVYVFAESKELSFVMTEIEK